MKKVHFDISSLLFATVLAVFGFGNISNVKSQEPNFKTWAETPPMGWNSYNCFGATVTEQEVKANAEYMEKKMKTLGWEYVVIDYCWSYPHPEGSTQDNPPQFRLPKDYCPVPWLAMDKYGRLLPDPRKFPSSQPGGSYKPLGDYVHSLGLKFGLHVMRGIPRQAVWAKSPVKGTNGITADMIADTTSVCLWLDNMYGIDMSKPGAQEYYNSIVELYAEWGVDYIKLDDTNGKNGYHQAEAEALLKAIINSKRKIVLSLSPSMNFENREHLKSVSNLWRISADFWDEWAMLKNQFELANKWTPYRGPGSWPDNDMLLIGRLSRRGPVGNERESHFTKDELFTHVFFWTIVKSPLMMGGDMTVNSPFIEELLTNVEVIQVNQKSYDARQLYRVDDKVVWTSKIPGSDEIYVAFFNLNNEDKNVSVSFSDLGLKGTHTVRNLWNKKDIGKFKNSFSEIIPTHGAGLYKITKK